MQLKDKLKRIIESDAKTTGVERVSLWLCDATRTSITSENIYILSKNEHIPGHTFYKKDYPAYFSAIESETIVDANDAMTDSRTAEFAENYLKPNGIVSMLDIAVRIGGNPVGIVCHEHVGTKRTWSKDELIFVTSIAEMIATAIENEEYLKSSKALLESELRFRQATTQLPLIFFTLDKELHFISSKGIGLKKLGLNEDELVGKTLYEFLETNDINNIAIKSHLEVLKGNSIIYEHHFKNIYFQIFLEPLKTENGEITGVSAMALDFTERKKAEKELQDKEEQYKTLFETANDSILLMDGQKFIDCNKRSVELFGCVDKKDLIGHSPVEFSPPKQPDGRDSAEKAAEFMKAALNGTPQRFYWKHLRKDAKLIDVEVTLNALQLKGKDYIQAIVRDITERKKLELEKENILFFNQSLIENSPIGIIVYKGATGECITANKAVGLIIGESVEELMKENYRQIPSWKKSDLLKYASLALETGKDQRFTAELVSNTGKDLWLDCSMSAVPCAEGTTNLLFMVLDNTQKKKAEEEIKNLSSERELLLKDRTDKMHYSEEKFSAVTDLSKDAIISVNNLGKIIFWNNAAEQMFGYTANEIMEKPVTIIIAPQHLEKHKKGFERYLSTQEAHIVGKGRFKFSGLKKNGTEFPIELSLRSWKVNGELFFTSNISDLTAKKSESELDLLFKMSSDLIGIAKTNAYFKLVNPAFSNSLGYTQVEFISKSFLDFIHPDDVQSTKEMFEKLAKGNAVTAFLNRLRCKNGTYKLFEWNAQSVETSVFVIGREVKKRKKEPEPKPESETDTQPLYSPNTLRNTSEISPSVA